MNTSKRLISQISSPLAGVAIACTGIGIASGLDRYLRRSPVHAQHMPGTAAWAPHIVVAAALATWYLLALRRHRRGPNRDGLLLLAPLGKRAASRLAATAMSARRGGNALRALLAVPPLVLLGYCCWRVGEQVTAGLDPDFTANAWGGPSYLGAMACHYLDAALLIAVSAWLLDRLLNRLPLPHPAA